MTISERKSGVIIVTHGRPDQVKTYQTLKRSGYKGRVILLVDDEDKTLPRYRERYGAEVHVFSKSAAASITDAGINNGDRRSVVFARNVCWSVARQHGLTHFVVLDDDYGSFQLRFLPDKTYGCVILRTAVNDVFNIMYDFLDSTQVSCVAWSQGGDHIGGDRDIETIRKVMNSFFCRTDRPFKYAGILNDDVNTYCTLGSRGHVFLTFLQAQLNQTQTQQNAGGLTELYLDTGTYVKSFFTTMMCPSFAEVSAMGDGRSGNYRLHHLVRWRNAAPKIISEMHRKASAHSTNTGVKRDKRK